jgi:hypothetical protein
LSKKWEYLVRDIGLVKEEGSKVFSHHRASNEEEQSLLCSMGEEGWELVAVKVSPTTTTAYFKREKA